MNHQIPNILGIYIVAISLVAAGYVDFSLIAYHFQNSGIVSPEWTAVFYSFAMAASAISSLVFGRLYDIKGLQSIIYVTAISALFAPLVFLGGFYFSLTGMILWGIGMGAQSTTLSAAIASLTPKESRGMGYGVAYLFFGISWFLGSAAMGFLYDVSVAYLVIFSVIAQLAAVPIFIRLNSKIKQGGEKG